MLGLGGLQGLVGWWMVKSGFKDKPNYQSRPRVSTYRLLVHNSFAVFLYSYLLYNGVSLLYFNTNKSLKSGSSLKFSKRWVVLLLHLFIFNLLSGVTVAGIDAGKVFNTWPDMNGAFIPNNYWDKSKSTKNIFENCATVQFNHRIFAYCTYVATMLFYLKSRKMRFPKNIKFGIISLTFLINFQLINGILMLLN